MKKYFISVFLILFIILSIFSNDLELFPFLIHYKPKKKSKFGYSEMENVKWGYMDKKGKTVISPQFSYAFPFNEEMAIVQILKREETKDSYKVFVYWGVIDKNGKIIIDPNFKRIESFSDGLAKAKLPDISIFDKDYEKLKKELRSGFIDKSGNFIIKWNLKDFRYDQTGNFSEGFARVVPPITLKKVKQLIKDEELINMIINLVSDDETMEIATSKNPVGYINKEGTLIIPNIFKTAGDFKEGLAYALSYELPIFGYINQNGYFIIKPQFEDVRNFSEGLASVSKNGLYGYINSKGKKLIEYSYDYAMDFHEGMAAVKKDGKFGFINTKGELIIKCKYDSTGYFSNGLASVGIIKDNKMTWGFINKTGNLIIPMKYTGWTAPFFKNGLALVQITEKMKSKEKWNRGQIVDVNKSGYIDTKGKWIYGPVKGPWDMYLN